MGPLGFDPVRSGFLWIIVGVAPPVMFLTAPGIKTCSPVFLAQREMLAFLILSKHAQPALLFPGTVHSVRQLLTLLQQCTFRFPDGEGGVMQRS